MFVNKNFSLKGIIAFSGHHVLWLTAWAGSVTALYEFFLFEYVSVPWLPYTIIGTAVAFYVGFKNNQSYGRLWEARIIWGGIVNSSRAWGSMVRSFTSTLFTSESISDHDINVISQRLIYRHIAWLYTLRDQLLVPTQWEHISMRSHISTIARRRREQWGIGLYNEEDIEKLVTSLLEPNEYKDLAKYKNKATHLIDEQSLELKALRERVLLDDFRHMELQKLLTEFYALQGKCERIKKFPLPRQYGSMSLIFTGIFIFLLPLGMASEFHKLGELGAWLAVPFTVLVCWIYIVMELVGDYSENPFEGTGNDIPMLSLCRTIEIDLRQMLGETNLPSPIEPKNGVLM